MPDKSWKAFERRVAKDLGGRRTSILGGEDIEHPIYSIECKLLSDIPQWLIKLWTQTAFNCPDSKTPLAIVKEKNRNDDNAFVILRYIDFKNLINGGKTWVSFGW